MTRILPLLHDAATSGCGQPGEGAIRYATPHGSSRLAHAARCPCPRVTAHRRLQHAHRQRAAVQPSLADTYGFGFLEHGAQQWFSGRGIVRGYPGEVIATNPGEVHDGRPLGPPTRRWRIAYVDVHVMTTLTASERGAGGHAEITSPVIADP